MKCLRVLHLRAKTNFFGLIVLKTWNYMTGIFVEEMWPIFNHESFQVPLATLFRGSKKEHGRNPTKYYIYFLFFCLFVHFHVFSPVCLLLFLQLILWTRRWRLSPTSSPVCWLKIQTDNATVLCVLTSDRTAYTASPPILQPPIANNLPATCLSLQFLKTVQYNHWTHCFFNHQNQ